MVIVLATCFSSDIMQERPKHIMAVATLSVVSLAIVAGVDSSPKVRYTFIAFGESQSSPTSRTVGLMEPGASGVWACSPMTLTYLSNTIAKPAEKRAVSIGIVNGLANLSSVYGSYIWPSSSAPRYIPGFVTTTMLQVCTLVFALLAWWLLARYPYPEAKRVVRNDADVERA